MDGLASMFQATRLEFASAPSLRSIFKWTAAEIAVIRVGFKCIKITNHLSTLINPKVKQAL